jgi:hypothetical protein
VPRHPFDAALVKETLPADPAARLAALREAAERQAVVALARTPAERDRRAARALRLLWARWWRPYQALSPRDRQRAQSLALAGPLVRLLNDPRHGPRLRGAYKRIGGPLGWAGVLGALFEGRRAAPLEAGVFESLLLFLRWQFVLARCDQGPHWYARPVRGRRSDVCPEHGRSRAVRGWLARRQQRREAFRQAHPQAWVWLDRLSRRIKTLSAQKRRRGHSEAWYREQVRQAVEACAAGLRSSRDGTPQEWVAFFGARSTLLGRSLAEALGLPARRG